MLVNYFIESSHMAFNVIAKDDNFALGPNDTLRPYSISEDGPKNGVKQIMGQPPKDAYPKGAEKVQNVVNSGSQSSSAPDLFERKYINSKR